MLVRMIPVRKDWYLGGGGSFSFCSLLNFSFFKQFLLGGGGGEGQWGIYSGFRGLPTLVITYHYF